MSKILRVLKFVLVGSVVIVALLLLTRVVIRSSIKSNHKIATANGIDEEVVADIGGIKQYLYLRGQDRDNPIILVLHGGPGSPMTPLVYAYQGGLEKDYTVVNWDQRNAGKTYFLNDAQLVYDTLSMDRMVEDVREIVVYLAERFDQEKVVIMGHSWGSALGTTFVHKYPELVSAYIGVGQVINPAEGDLLAFEKAKSAAYLAGSKRDIETFESLTGFLINDASFTQSSFVTGRRLINKYLSPLPDKTLRLLLLSPYYSLKDDSFFLKDTFKLQRPLMDDLVYKFDARTLGSDYQVPVYYILGDLDWVTPSVMAVEFFENIQAPNKQLVMIEGAGHMTMLDEPSDFCEAVLSVLK